jgi:hypothetical protein
VVRKWSYITNFFSLNNDCLKSHSLHVRCRYKVKIFRKNTRFKNFNVSYTSFIRKVFTLKLRRTNWKPYLILSSVWVKHVLSFKKTIMFSQSYSLYNYTITYSYLTMLSKKSNFTNLVGVSRYALTHLNLKQRSHQTISNTLSPLISDQNFKKSILTQYAHFNSLNSLEKLTSLGFPFTTTVIDHQCFTTNSLWLFQNPPYNTSVRVNLFLKKSILSQCITFKKIHILLTLLMITNNTIT